MRAGAWRPCLGSRQRAPQLRMMHMARPKTERAKAKAHGERLAETMDVIYLSRELESIAHS